VRKLGILHFIKWLLCFLGLGLLAGCVSLRAPSAAKPALNQHQGRDARLAQLAKIRSWKINGAFSIQYRDRNDIANYWWRQKGARYRIRMASSLNLYTATIHGKPGLVSFTRDGRHYTATSPEQLMQQQLGWLLPVTNLVYWLKDMPAPHAKYQAHYDAYGRIVSLQQQGWTIQYPQFTAVDKKDLPQLLNLSRPGIKVRIVIKQWRI